MVALKWTIQMKWLNVQNVKDLERLSILHHFGTPDLIVVNNMNKKAKPGDTIVITKEGNRDEGNKYFVIECPRTFKGSYLQHETWVIKDGEECWYYNDWCAIVRQSDVVKETSECKYCRGTGKIALLTSVVDCDCVTQKNETKEGPQDFPQGSDIYNAWYSEESAKTHSYNVYRHATTGEEITITEISSCSIPCSKHKDLKFVGIIDKREHVRHISK